MSLMREIARALSQVRFSIYLKEKRKMVEERERVSDTYFHFFLFFLNATDTRVI